MLFGVLAVENAKQRLVAEELVAVLDEVGATVGDTDHFLARQHALRSGGGVQFVPEAVSVVAPVQQDASAGALLTGVFPEVGQFPCTPRGRRPVVSARSTPWASQRPRIGCSAPDGEGHVRRSR